MDQPTAQSQRRAYLSFGVPVAAGLLVAIVYIVAAKAVWLDDTYLFLRYVDTLRSGGGFPAFNPGEVSYGSFSPLWTVLIALLPLNPLRLAVWLSAIFYVITGGILSLAVARVTRRQWIGILFGLLFVAYPSAIKVGVGGLEVGLLVLLLALLLHHSMSAAPRIWLLGLLCGLVTLLRPDGLVLLLALLVWLLYRYLGEAGLIQRLLMLLLAFILVIAPWLLFVYGQTGSLPPLTRRGKMLLWLPIFYGVNYEQYYAQGILSRLTGYGLRNLIGFFTDYRQFILLSALLSLPLLFVRHYEKPVRAALLLGLIYTLGLPLFYALTYPLISFVHATPMLLFALFGLALAVDTLVDLLAARFHNATLIDRWLPLAALGLAAMLLIGLHALSFSGYLSQVEQQWIQNETGRWLRENSPEDATIASEPLGGLAYYADRYVVGLGALVSDEGLAMMPNGCSASEEAGSYLLEVRPSHFADCSSLCVGPAILDSADINYTTLYSQESTGENILGCQVYALEYPEDSSG